MTEKRKVQIEAEVTADTTGLEQIAQAAQGMAEAVQEAGQQAAQGLNAVSQGAAPAAEGLDAAQRRMQASIQRTVATMKAGAAGSADYYEALARSRNIDTAPLDAYIGELRRVEQAQRAAKQATTDTAKADAFIASLRQQAEAIGRTRSEVLALQAAELGLSGQASQYIQRLRQIEQGQNSVGTSAKQTAFAMRTIPAQLQDIAVSLQGGQNPLTVLSQQGSQIATVFGGVGPAIRGVGAYILGLVNPFTVAAAAAVGLTVAIVQGGKEQDAYQRALIMTGNSAGKTASQLGDMARALGSGNFTQSEAAAALAEMVKSGAAAGDQLQRFTAVALEMERATGQAISKTAAQFKELGEAPLAASVKLNAEIHHLTAALYEQIKALDEQGRHTEAARVATEAYADTLATRSKQIIANNGFLVTSWEAVSLAVRKAANAMLDFGRDATGSEQLASLRNQLSIREQRGPLRPQDPASVTAFESGNKVLRDQIGLIETLNKRQAEGSQEQAKQNQQLQNKIEWDKQGVQFLTKQQQLRKELTRAETEGQALLKAGLITEEQLRTRLAGIREKFKDTKSGAAGTGQNEVAAIQARVREQQQYLEQLQRQLSTGAFGDDAKLSDGERKVLEIQEQLKTSISGVARAEKERALAAAQSLVAVDRQVSAQERQNKAYQEAVATLGKQADAASQQADSIRQQALGQEAANATFGKSKTAVEELVLAQLKLQAAEAESTDTFDPRYVAGLNAKVEAQTRYVASLQEAANKQATLANANLAGDNQRDTDLLQLEFSLAGQTQEVRQRIVEQRRIELDYAKRIADVDKQGLTPADAAARKAELATQQVIAVSNAGARATLDEWQRTTDSINASLTDALLRGFESGKDFAGNLRDTVKNMFATLVLRPVIQAVMSPVSGMLTGIGQQIGGTLFGGTGGAVGAGGSLLSTAGSAGSLLGLGSSIGTAFTAGSSSVGVMAGSLAGSGGLLGGAASALAAMGPVGWAGLAAAAAYAIFSKQGGGPKSESGAGIGVRTTGDIGGVATTIQAIQQQYASIISGLGGKAGNLDLGIFSAQDPQGTALTQLAFNASLNGRSIYNRGDRLGGIENVGRSEQDLQNAVTAETQRVVLTALASSNLTGSIGEYLKQLGDINALSDGAVQASLNRAQAIATQQAQIQAQIFDLTATDPEKLTRARADERNAVDETNRSLLDRLYALQDEKKATDEATAALQKANAQQADIQGRIFDVTATETEKLAKQRADERAAVDESNRSLLDRLYALQDEKKATDEAAAAIDNAKASAAQFSDFLKGINNGISGFIDRLNASPEGLLPPEVQVSNSKNQFDRQLELARSGDRDALGSITDYANQVIELQTAFTASGAETAKVIADVKAMLFGLTLGPIATPGIDVAQPAPAIFTQPAPLPIGQQASPVPAADSGLIQEVVNLRNEVERLTAVVASYASRDLENGQALVAAVTSNSNAALLERVA